MSRKRRKAGRGRAGERPAPARKRLRRARAAVLLPLALCVIAAGAASLRWEPLRHALGLPPIPAPAAQATPTPLQLSKEYVYVGGRLVATEEPTPLPSGPPPTNLVAAATTINPPAATVHVTWAAPASGAPSSYVVERKAASGQFQPVGQPVTAPATSFDDTSAAEGAAYLYRVKAVYAGGGASDYSNTDLATTVAFSDDPLIGANDPQNRQATVIRAAHLNELRRAVSAVHDLAGLGANISWTYPNPLSSPPEQRRAIYLEDMQELRTFLNPALSALGVTPLPDDTTLGRGLPVKAAHLQDVRDKVR